MDKLESQLQLCQNDEARPLSDKQKHDKNNENK